MKLNKKAGYDFKDISWIAITLGVGILILSITTTIVGDVRKAHPRDGNFVANESDAVNLVWYNATNMTLDHLDVSVSAVYNCTPGSGDETIPSSNYTVFSSLGKIQCDDNVTDTMIVCVNYSYLDEDAVYNLTYKGEQGQVKFANWLPTIGLVLGAIIVITTLFALGFVKKG